MARFVYGDSFGDVANRELAMDAARDSRFFNSLSQQRALEQLALQQQQAELQNMLAMAQIGEGNRRYYRDELPMKRQAQQLTLLDRILQQQQFQQQVGQRDREMAQRERLAKMQYGDVGGERDYGEAQEQILSGLLTPEDLPGAFPRLQPIQQNRLATYFKRLAEDEAEAEAMRKAMAVLPNERLLGLRKQAALLAAQTDASAAREGWNWKWGKNSESAINQRLKETEQAIAAGRGIDQAQIDPKQFSDFLNDVLRNRALAESIVFDEQSGKFVPIPVPRRFSRQPTAVPPSAVGALTPAAASPSAAGVPTPMSPAEFASLPKGAFYRNPADGQIYRKK